MEDNRGVGVGCDGCRGIIIHNRVRRNAAEGIKIDASGSEEEPLSVERNTLLRNTGTGIGVWSSTVDILGNTIGETRAAAQETMGDGIVVSSVQREGQAAPSPSVVRIEGNDIHGCHRAGVILSDESRGIIIHNRVASTGSAGIWLQHGASGTVDHNVVDNAALMGIGVYQAEGVLTGNVVLSTHDYDWYDFETDVNHMIGHGVGFLREATGSALGNIAALNTRAGFLLDSTTKENVTGLTGEELPGEDLNIVAGNGECGFGLQGGAETMMGSVNAVHEVDADTINSRVADNLEGHVSAGVEGVPAMLRDNGPGSENGNGDPSSNVRESTYFTPTAVSGPEAGE